ncbi:phosphatidylinositol-specific phospholipase C [Stachybotrys elegans]|uniref:Phosphatidylinositol-specific phospholipase C n=1 Tax=Stachybotrys elegans TaxID=80388 RepID=A0A8K0SZE6_9HYPO|nr:phosphatidylinositol-specific phospholipase C [Stachybotrys elegans]
MADLSIRNFTIHPIELVTVQRFESEKVQSGDLIKNVTGTISSFLNATDFSRHEVRAQGDARSKDNVSVRIDPFKTKKTDIRTADGSREVIRLTFKSEDHKYETDIPSPSKKSAVMRKLDGGPHELTVVYVQTGAFLTIFSSARLHAWMKELNGDWPLSVLSIPGTHDSPTCHTALPSVRCQAVSIFDQLNNGVRFLDIRVSVEPNEDGLALVHGAFPISLTGTKWFGDMCEDVYEFLEKNPSETVIMSLKREGTGKGNDNDLGKTLKRAYTDKKRERWYTDPRIPKLSAVRGKIVLLRRFLLDESLRGCWDGRGWALDAGSWPDNCEDGKCGDLARVQDFYEITETENIQKKIDFSRGQLERAAEQNYNLGTDHHTPPFFVNFLSASHFFNANCWPERIAAKVNPAIIEYLCLRHGEEGKGPRKLKVGCAGTGIVVTDWVGANDDWDLIRCIVGFNARLQRK